MLAAAGLLVVLDGPLPVGDVLGGIVVTGFVINSLFFADDEVKPDADEVEPVDEQFEEIEAAQHEARKKGRPDLIRNIDRSKQRFKQRVRDEAEEAIDRLKKKEKEGGN